MSVEKRDGDHGLREALASDSKDVAAAHAKWMPKAKADLPPKVEPTLLENPVLATEDERLAMISQVYDTAVRHMHDAEDGKVVGVIGAKAYSLGIMHEVFDMTAEDIAADEGALSDLTEYTVDMLDKAHGIYIGDDLGAEVASDPAVKPVLDILATWNLPDRSFGQPYMYQRVNWA